jgi:hypothetical protein
MSQRSFANLQVGVGEGVVMQYLMKLDVRVLCNSFHCCARAHHKSILSRGLHCIWDWSCRVSMLRIFNAPRAACDKSPVFGLTCP